MGQKLGRELVDWCLPSTVPERRAVSARVRVDGKFFAQAGQRFAFRGVTYGTFRPRDDGARYPDCDTVKRDFAAIQDAGFTVVRTYTPPPDDVLDLAEEHELRLLVDVFYPDWRYLTGTSRSARAQMARDAETEVRAVTRRLAGNPVVLGLSLGNEIPADAVRWFGAPAVVRLLERLATVVREEDPEQLVTYANFPTTEYLSLDCLDFLTFNVFLEDQGDFRRYLTRLQHLAGDRPLVVGEVGLDAGAGPAGEERQRDVLDWQLHTMLERGLAGSCVFSWTDEWWVGERAVEGWHFGLTRADRSQRPALATATMWNDRTVADLPYDWPSITIVICAYNASATLDECLRHTCALNYPQLEIVVVDDGSTDTTAAITRRYRDVRLLHIPHAGLSAARNAGLQVATGDMVAYLDSDAFPSPEWPYFLALGLDGPDVVGVGGPNIPPVDAPSGERRVAQAPGGPVHVLTSDDRAEHIPGCNMAFWRQTLVEVGGFDPVYTSAGDDVDLCWRVLERGWQIGFHPSALVWHHRRSGLRPYLRQQLGYGRSEAMVEARHPDRFTVWGTARWRGSIYDSAKRTVTPQRIYRGQYGAAAFQSVYRGGGHMLDIVHQAGVPIAGALMITGPLALYNRVLAAPALAALVAMVVLAAVDLMRVQPPRQEGGGLRFRAGVTAMQLLQPVVRTWGRWRHRSILPLHGGPAPPLAGPMRSVGRGTVMAPYQHSRPQLTAAVVNALQRAGTRVAPGTGWEDFDARIHGGAFVVAFLVTTDHLKGWVQVRIRRRLRWRVAAAALAVTGLVSLVSPLLAVILVGAASLEIGRGLWLTGKRVRRLLSGLSND